MAKAAEEVLEKLPESLGYLLIDGNMGIPLQQPQEPIVKGDQKLEVISAASIVAKVTRDRLMKGYDSEYPQYGFAGHKGYPTKKHREMIRCFGPSAIHRRTFAGVKEYV
jgi:ribonuclease HII